MFSLASKELYIAQKESQEEEQATGGTTGQPQTDDGSQDQTGQRSAQPKKVKLNKRTSGQKVQKGGEKNQNCCWYYFGPVLMMPIPYIYEITISNN